MAILIVRLGDDQYVKWSNTTDSPVGYVMGRDELIRHLESEDQLTFSQAAHLIDLTDETGTSDPDTRREHLLATNRAGPGETQLAVDDIVRQYQGPGRANR